jgi:hypothetical protein
MGTERLAAAIQNVATKLYVSGLRRLEHVIA